MTFSQIILVAALPQYRIHTLHSYLEWEYFFIAIEYNYIPLGSIYRKFLK